VNVAVVPLYVTDPATAAPLGSDTVKVVAVSVEGFMAMLKIAVIVVLMTTLVAPAVGVVDTTDGTLTTS
jgi:hypothetical protein